MLPVHGWGRGAKEEEGGLAVLEGKFRGGHLTSLEVRLFFSVWLLPTNNTPFPPHSPHHPPAHLHCHERVHIGAAVISIFDHGRRKGLGLELHNLHFMLVDQGCYNIFKVVHESKMGCNELVTCPGRVDVTHKIINGDRLQYLQVTLSGGQSRKMDGRTEVGTKWCQMSTRGCCVVFNRYFGLEWVASSSKAEG